MGEPQLRVMLSPADRASYQRSLSGPAQRLIQSSFRRSLSANSEFLRRLPAERRLRGSGGCAASGRRILFSASRQKVVYFLPEMCYTKHISPESPCPDRLPRTRENSVLDWILSAMCVRLPPALPCLQNALPTPLFAQGFFLLRF